MNKLKLLLSVSAIGILANTTHVIAYHALDNHDEFACNTNSKLSIDQFHLMGDQELQHLLESTDRSAPTEVQSQKEEELEANTSRATVSSESEESIDGKPKFTACSGDELLEYAQMVKCVYPGDGFTPDSQQSEFLTKYVEQGYGVNFINTDSRGHTAYLLTKGNHIKVITAGTYNNGYALVDGVDWRSYNLNARKATASWMPKEYQGERVYAHCGFINSADLVLKQIEPLINAYRTQLVAQKRDPRDVTIDFVGHSLGAATAKGLGYAAWKKGLFNPEQIKIIQFEPPTFGNRAFELDLNQNGPQTISVFNPQDLVIGTGAIDTYHSCHAAIKLNDKHGMLGSHYMDNVIAELERRVRANEILPDSVEEFNQVAKSSGKWRITEGLNRFSDFVFGRTKAKVNEVFDPEIENSIHQAVARHRAALDIAEDEGDKDAIAHEAMALEEAEMNKKVLFAKRALTKAGCALSSDEIVRILARFESPKDVDRMLEEHDASFAHTMSQLQDQQQGLEKKIKSYKKNLGRIVTLNRDQTLKKLEATELELGRLKSCEDNLARAAKDQRKEIEWEGNLFKFMHSGLSN